MSTSQEVSNIVHNIIFYMRIMHIVYLLVMTICIGKLKKLCNDNEMRLEENAVHASEYNGYKVGSHI